MSSRIAVRRRLGDEHRADRAAGAGAVLREHRLATHLQQALSHPRPTMSVRAAGRERDARARAFRVGLRPHWDATRPLSATRQLPNCFFICKAPLVKGLLRESVAEALFSVSARSPTPSPAQSRPRVSRSGRQPSSTDQIAVIEASGIPGTSSWRPPSSTRSMSLRAGTA